MSVFQFYSLTEQEAFAFRNNPEICRVLLTACSSLATKLADVAGIYTPLTLEDEHVLQGAHRVFQAHTGYEYEGELDCLCKAAGLLSSDAGLLQGRIETLYREREPSVAEAEARAILEQWLRNQE